MIAEPPLEDDAPPPEDERVPSEGDPVPAAAVTPASVPAGAIGHDAVVAPGAEAIPGILERLGIVEEIAEYLYTELSKYPAGGPWFWKELSPQQRRDLWVELDEFVTWLQNRILRHASNPEGWIAPCWYLHPDAVEPLTALMVAHQAAYRAKSQKPSFELTEWFTRGLWPTLDAFTRRTTFKNCVAEGEHRPSAGGKVLTGSSTDFLAFVATDTTGHPAVEGEHGA
jgi:hypothetical protein